MAGDDDKKYYRNPEYTNEGLLQDMAGKKRRSGPQDRQTPGEFDLDPVKGEPVNLELEQRLLSHEAAEDDQSRKRTLHDPRKFEELMKERMAQIQQPDVQKITNQEMDALRSSGARSNSSDVVAKQKMNAFLQNVSTTLGGLFSSQKKQTMCENYGHIAPAHWRGDFPKCTECGKQIMSQSELRKSSASQKTADIKPHDNKLEL
jgi:hypothetical protein